MGLLLGQNLVQLRVRLDAGLVKSPRPLQVSVGHGQGTPGLLQVGSGHAQVSLGLDDLLAVFLVLQDGQKLPAAHRIADIDQEPVQAAGDLRGHDDIGLGGQGAGKPGQVAQRAFLDGRDLDGHGNAAGTGAFSTLGFLIYFPAQEGNDQRHSGNQEQFVA